MLLCDMGAGTMRPVTGKNSLEETYKGCRHKLAKYIQETQQDSESGMEVKTFA
jgi:hypothetical protein